MPKVKLGCCSSSNSISAGTIVPSGVAMCHTTLSKMTYCCPPWTLNKITLSPLCNTRWLKISVNIKKSASTVNLWSMFTSSGLVFVIVPTMTATGLAASMTSIAALFIASSMSNHLQCDGHGMLGTIKSMRYLVHHHRLVNVQRFNDHWQVHSDPHPDVPDCLHFERALLAIFQLHQLVQQLPNLRCVHILVHRLIQLQHTPSSDI